MDKIEQEFNGYILFFGQENDKVIIEAIDYLLYILLLKEQLKTDNLFPFHLCSGTTNNELF